MSSINIIKASVTTGRGPDYVHLETDMPATAWPFNGHLTMTFTTSSGEGENWVRKNLNIEPHVVVLEDCNYFS